MSKERPPPPSSSSSSVVYTAFLILGEPWFNGYHVHGYWTCLGGVIYRLLLVLLLLLLFVSASCLLPNMQLRSNWPYNQINKFLKIILELYVKCLCH